MLIVEGPDCVGKTTLCHRLLSALNAQPGTSRWRYQHFGSLPKDFTTLLDYSDAMAPYVVSDRFHLSEAIYSVAYGRPTFMTRELFWAIENYIQSNFGYTRVFIVAHTDEVLTRCERIKVDGARNKFAEPEPPTTVNKIVNALFRWYCSVGLPDERFTSQINALANIIGSPPRPQRAWRAIVVSKEPRNRVVFPFENTDGSAAPQFPRIIAEATEQAKTSIANRGR